MINKKLEILSVFYQISSSFLPIRFSFKILSDFLTFALFSPVTIGYSSAISKSRTLKIILILLKNDSADRTKNFNSIEIICYTQCVKTERCAIYVFVFVCVCVRILFSITFYYLLIEKRLKSSKIVDKMWIERKVFFLTEKINTIIIDLLTW